MEIGLYLTEENPQSGFRIAKLFFECETVSFEQRHDIVPAKELNVARRTEYVPLNDIGRHTGTRDVRRRDIDVTFARKTFI